MKQVLGLILCMILLGACGSEQTAQPTEEVVKAEETKKDKASESKGDSMKEETESQKHADQQKKEKEELKKTEPMYELSNNWSFQPITSEGNAKVALLTIDDAPDKHGLEMAKTLKSLEAPAIFFVNGHFIDTPEEAAQLKKIHELGFAIGNHTASHSSLPDLTKQEQHEEIVGLNDRIEAIIGERPKFFRAPFGQNTEYSKHLAKEEGMLVMNWTYGYDWDKEYMTEKAIADIMVNTPLLANGANLLMHDREWTANALDDIVSGLREKGFELLNPDLIKTP
ncbi:polysaccharide deacetylase family protein [Thalassobacillus pellis]|uniref:polysaccharide deacetylase family protein n=1 Tax=Thalassobacillus pellis TaxID=748008 RepID=UPI0019621AA5|nr:polysaccharide deacetylase family protein [Thalassobacillus pellis]MBM7552916.1 peptidoglycan/xylan/chitin deacetylase (PgdA/CDA1 family) [Thalassobacillus pellis]